LDLARRGGRKYDKIFILIIFFVVMCHINYPQGSFGKVGKEEDLQEHSF
jgi:hypothetical protein